MQFFSPVNNYMKQIAVLLFVLLSVNSIFGQSKNQSSPTPVLQSEVFGSIAPRDIGDSRLTQHFYTFFADNGDLFVNLETTNFTGDVDLFAAGTLRPLSKISFYGDETKTSRIVYFRQREQIVLRVEGRTPNDETANYKINFTGSFVAATDLPVPNDDLEPQVKEKTDATATARVNSVGTIIEVITPKAKSEPEIVSPEIVEVAKTPTVKAPPRRRQPRIAAPKRTPARTTATARKPTKRPAAAVKAEPKPDPLINLRLVVELKDGYKIERPMSEVLRVNVDKNQLIVITKDGKIERFVLLDVLKFSIEQ